jgi:hypothetical protein
MSLVVERLGLLKILAVFRVTVAGRREVASADN